MDPSPNDHSKTTLDRIICMGNGFSIVLSSSPGFTEFSDKYSKFLSKYHEQSLFESIIFNNCLDTFDINWKLELFTPEQMAKAGYFYLGSDDHVRCMLCCRDFLDWNNLDNLLLKHRRISPNCNFFQEKIVGDICGVNSSPVIKYNGPQAKIYNFLDFMGMVENITFPLHRHLGAYEFRLKTYENLKTKIRFGAEALCEAGFLYAGDGQNDSVVCFCCNLGLRSWTDDDDPWIEHARWSPRCTYVLLSKGTVFVYNACSYLPEISNDTNNVPLQCDTTDDFILGSNYEIDSSEPDQTETKNNNNQIVTSELKNLSLQDPDLIPDSWLCKICCRDFIKVAVLPCGHIFSCINCCLTLKNCAVCRSTFRVLIIVDFDYIKEKDEDDSLDKVSSNSSLECSDKSLDSVLCKLCKKNQMGAVFLPCKHVYTCIECANSLEKCPICSSGIFATLPVYF